jgi:putative lipase involved disintegration of autophagic bodies
MSIDMEYRVHISLTIHSFDGTKAAFFGKEVLLPFVSFLGLRLQGALGASESVNSVTFSQSD